MEQNTSPINRKLFCGDVETNRKNLFEEALLQAKHGKVLYILKQELNELPQLSQDFSSINQHYMKMISFLYAKTLGSLIESLCSLPDWQNMPATIILDDFSAYCNNNMIQNACGLVALLIDSAKSCSKSLGVQCTLCISVTKETVSEEYCSTLKELYNF